MRRLLTGDGRCMARYEARHVMMREIHNRVVHVEDRRLRVVVGQAVVPRQIQFGRQTEFLLQVRMLRIACRPLLILIDLPGDPHVSCVPFARFLPKKTKLLQSQDLARNQRINTDLEGSEESEAEGALMPLK